MAVNNEEDFDSPSIPLPGNLSDPNQPASNTEPINTNPEIENMDVHTHPHQVTHKKKLPEYPLEFFMLFLATNRQF